MRGVGAYGLVLKGLGGVDQWLNPAPHSWVDVDVTQKSGRSVDWTRVGDETAEIVLPGQKGILVERDPPGICFLGDGELPPPSLIVHPYLAPAASVLAHWQGWVPLHAGAFCVDNGAWLLMAEREGGKSTTLAALSEQGIGVLADDLAVLRGNRVLAGPRSVDLREGRGASSIDLGVIGARHRWRISLAGVAPETPVVGAIRLVWSDTLSIRRLTAGERTSALASSLSMSVDAQSFLQALAIPCYELSRPHGAVADTISLLLEAASG